MRKLYCRGCNGDGALDVDCRCHGRSTSYDCPLCSNCGLVEAKCVICKGSGNVSSWEDVKEGILFQRGDIILDDYDDGPDPDELYDRMKEKDDW